MSGLVEHLLATPAWLTVLVVFALPALESSAFLGFVFPGEAAALLGGVAASQGHAPVGIVVAAAVGGAILGDAVGYVVGRCWGRRILDGTLGRFIRAEHLDRAEIALARRGALAVFLGRFTVALRVMIPGLAGMSGMQYRRFAAANIAGGSLWGGSVVIAGFLAGSSWQRVGHLLSAGGIALTGAAITLLVLIHLVRRRRARRAASRSMARTEPKRDAQPAG